MTNIIVQMVIAYVSVWFIAITLESPKRTLPFASLAGALGWGVYQIGLFYMNKVTATLFAGLFIAWLSHLLARKLKTPVTVYFIPGFIPLVPGMGVYQVVYAFIRNDYVTAQASLVETLQISGAIALAIFFVDSVFGVLERIRAAKAREARLKGK